MVLRKEKIVVYERIDSPGVQIRYYDIPVANAGDRPLTFDKADVSCRCTAIDFPSAVPAGSEAMVKATVTIPRGVADFKRVDVALHSNDRKSPVMLCTLEIHVRQAMSLSTEHLDFGEVVEKRKSGRSFAVDVELSALTQGSALKDVLGSHVKWRPVERRRYEFKERPYEKQIGQLTIENTGAVGEHRERLDFVLASSPDVRRSVECVWKTVPAARFIPVQAILKEGDVDVVCALVLADEDDDVVNIEFDRALLNVTIRENGGSLEVVLKALASVAERRVVPIRLHTGKGDVAELSLTLLPAS